MVKISLCARYTMEAPTLIWNAFMFSFIFFWWKCLYVFWGTIMEWIHWPRKMAETPNVYYFWLHPGVTDLHLLDPIIILLCRSLNKMVQLKSKKIQNKNRKKKRKTKPRSYFLEQLSSGSDLESICTPLSKWVLIGYQIKFLSFPLNTHCNYGHNHNICRSIQP